MRLVGLSVGVHIGEALNLLSVLNRVHKLNMRLVDFELDLKVVDSFCSSKHNITEFGDIIIFIITPALSLCCADKMAAALGHDNFTWWDAIPHGLLLQNMMLPRTPCSALAADSSFVVYHPLSKLLLIYRSV